MPSKNMLRKGDRRKSVKADYRIARDAANEAAEARKREEERRIYEGIEPEAITVPEPVAAIAEPVAIPRRTKVRTSPKEMRAQRAELAAKAEAENRVRQQNRAEAPVPLAPSVTQDGAQRTIVAGKDDRDTRLDQFLVRVLPHLSRSRVQMLIDSGQVAVNGRAEKSRYKAQPGDTVVVTGEPQPAPLRAIAEDIPLTVIYEDDDLAVIDKPAGMQVHAGSGATDDARNSGTLVNALLHHFRGQLSSVGGELRPGIVHRLDKDTSGLILVAKNDQAHQAMAEMFHDHTLEKRYIALVHRLVRNDSGTIDLPIARDPVRRTRMTTRSGESMITTASHGRPSLRAPEERDEDDLPSRRGREARSATTHYRVLERLQTGAGDFTLLDVEIETGRTHQIRVHMKALGHPVVGDTLYGAPRRIRGFDTPATTADPEAPTLPRNFLHAAHLALTHPVTGEPLEFDAPLPAELEKMLEELRTLQP